MKYLFLIYALGLTGIGPRALSEQSNEVTFTHYGHACFLMTTSSHLRILTDPMKMDGYSIPDSVKPDVVTVSHHHFDHDNVAGVAGQPLVLYGTKGASDDAEKHTFVPVDTQVDGVHIYDLVSNHFDAAKNPTLSAIFVFEFDSLRVVHLGDLGYRLTDEQIAKIGPVDVVMIPVGGVYTFTPVQADSLIARLKPRMVVFPMHYKTKAAGFLEYTAEDFLKGKSNVERIAGDSFTLDRRNPPKETRYVVLRTPVK